MFNCASCDKVFMKKCNLKRHTLQKHSANARSVEVAIQAYNCGSCNKTFVNLQNMNRHILQKHIATANSIDDVCKDDVSSKQISKMCQKRCDDCGILIYNTNFNNHLKSNLHRRNAIHIKYKEMDDVTIINSTYKTRIISFNIRKDGVHLSIQDYMMSLRDKVVALIDDYVQLHTAVKVNIELFGSYIKANNIDDVEPSCIKSFATRNYIVTGDTDEEATQVYNKCISIILTKSEDHQGRDSGWALQNILHLELNVNKYSPLRGSSYLPLPKFIEDRKAVINIKNNDDKCFAWAVTAARYPVESLKHRVISYSNSITKINFSIPFPTRITDIAVFEKLNLDISINVFGIDIAKKLIVGPLYLTKSRKQYHVNLLYIEGGLNNHYCWINDLSRLVRSQITRHKSQIYLCDGCLIHFPTVERLRVHQSNDCNKVVTTFSKNNTIKFDKYSRKITAPFIIYCDFETFLNPIQTCSNIQNNAFTQNVQEHELYSFGYYIKCSFDDNESKYNMYRGLDCIKVLMTDLRSDVNKITKILSKVIAMKPLTDKQKFEYDNATHCHICEEQFTVDDADGKVRDHFHLGDGHFVGAAHSNCNLNYKLPSFIPVVFHNLSGYDAHFIFKNFYGTDGDIIMGLLPINKEKYISFQIKMKVDFRVVTLRFIDSFRFMSSSLEVLAKNLQEDKFIESKRIFGDTNKFSLINRKGIFPYDYIDSLERLNDDKLPPIEAFYNKLTDSNIDVQMYAHARNVWNEFKCSTLGEYSDIYLKSDVMLLTDIFENFRKVCANTYQLDPAQYFSAPGLSWDSMLKFTKIKLKLIDDIDIHHFIAKGIRGGLSQCSVHYATANNEYLPNHDKSKASNYLIYLDANNLYGWAMAQYLPYDNFAWMDDNLIKTFNVLDIANDSSIGYILEVDLEYPESLHTYHSDLPFCIEQRIPPSGTCKSSMLLASLYDKKNYIIHYRNLKQALEAGLVLTKIHRILHFKQSPWLKPYIDYNTTLRKNASNTFEKDFFKLMINSVYGKTMENVDKRVDVKIVSKWRCEGNEYDACTLIGKPNFHSSLIINSELTAIQMNRLNVIYNKPMYIGFSVLEMSKSLMYDFHYGYIKKKYDSRVELLYTDTDSFIYSIQTNDFYEDIKPDIYRFDTSDYPADNIYKLPLVNGKLLGKFKDETRGFPITVFAGVRAKSYSFKTVKDTVKKIKGVSKHVVNKKITFDHFKNFIFNDMTLLSTMYTFRSIGHKVYTQQVNKHCLSGIDNKRYQIPNSYKTLPWGSVNIKNYK